jgi:hypothetical protein
MEQNKTQEQLNEIVQYWQKELRLSDWYIEVRHGNKKEMDGNIGYLIPCSQYKCAEILVCKFKNYPANAYYPYDPDFIVVHELLHLSQLFYTDDRISDERYQDHLEFSINSTAMLLVKLRRASRD